MMLNIRNIFRVPHAHELAVRELNEAKRELLSAQTARDYAIAVVQYNEDRIARLEAYLGVEK